jgi:hypothetical protein
LFFFNSWIFPVLFFLLAKIKQNSYSFIGFYLGSGRSGRSVFTCSLGTCVRGHAIMPRWLYRDLERVSYGTIVGYRPIDHNPKIIIHKESLVLTGD